MCCDINIVYRHVTCCYANFKGVARQGIRIEAQKHTLCNESVAKSMCHAALISALVLSPFAAVTTSATEMPQVSSEANSSTNATATDANTSSSCPDFTGIRKYVCYGPCCGVPWGPGGPIFLALSAGAFRTAMPFRYSSWLRSKEEDPELGTVDRPVLAFSAALFLTSAPFTFGGVAASWLLLVLCLV